MTTITCTVCGATEDPGADHTCPVCGADLPAPEAATAEAPDAADTHPTADTPEGPAAPGSAEDPRPEPAPGPASPPPPPPPPAPPAGAGRPSAAPGRPSPYDPSHPSGLSDSVRTYGTFTHLSAFAMFLGFPIIGPLVLWLIRRDEHPFLDHHGKEALNFNLSLLLYLVVGVVVSIVTIGVGLFVVVPAAVVLGVMWIVTTIQAAIKANRGEGYRYPVTIRFIAD